jgi:hypothetical protein
VIDRRAPVLTHSWLGSLYRNGDQELIGSIELDPAIRPPRDNGDRDAEVLLEVGAIGPGPELDAHLDAGPEALCPRSRAAGMGAVLVRHEALLLRMEVKDRPSPCCRSSRVKLEAA